jgi:hypothetical protein
VPVQFIEPKNLTSAFIGILKLAKPLKATTPLANQSSQPHYLPTKASAPKEVPPHLNSRIT